MQGSWWRSALRAVQAVRTLAEMEVAAIGFVRVAPLATQDPNLGKGMVIALPVGALQQNLAIRVALADLNRCLRGPCHISTSEGAPFCA